MTNSDELERQLHKKERQVENLHMLRVGDSVTIANLTAEVEKLKAENAELKGKNSALTEELKCKGDSNALAQIERMKCCGNCNNWSVKLGYDSKCKLDVPCSFGKHDKWELIKNLDK